LLRSPWVDFELRRAGSNVQTAKEELYGLQAEGGRKLFKADSLAIMKVTVRTPDIMGEIEEYTESNERKYRVRRDPNGRIHIFGELGDGVRGPFAAASDISYGRGASYSTLEIVDIPTGRQVLDFAADDLGPVPFAQTVFALLTWINGDKGDGHTYFTFENNGEQGNAFGDELRRLGYSNIMRQKYAAISRVNNETSYYGHRNRDGGSSNLSQLERAILDGECLVLSELLREELDSMGRDDRGRPSFPQSEKGHGDRAQAAGMMWAVARDHGAEYFLDQSAEISPDRQTEESFSAEPVSWSKAWSIPR
jgi:hypothetical protein